MENITSRYSRDPSHSLGPLPERSERLDNALSRLISILDRVNQGDTALKNVQRLLHSRSRSVTLNRRPQTEAFWGRPSGQARWGKLSGEALQDDIRFLHVILHDPGWDLQTLAL